MGKTIKNTKGLELVTSRYSGYDTSSKILSGLEEKLCVR